jgi:hypothetical protein
VDGRDVSGIGDRLSLLPPAGWAVSAPATVSPDGFRVVLTPPGRPEAGRALIEARLDGSPASRLRRASRADFGELVITEPADIPVLAVDAALPDGARVGYAGGGADRVATWLARLGVEVGEFDAARLEAADLGAFTTIVIGILAFGMRPDLAAARPRLAEFVRQGGHLVTLYHRPGEWEPAAMPLPIEVGSPSIRWRVTDPAAPVTVLEPDHVLLTRPNRLAAADWAGWDKERGLYFAARRDPAYKALLAMADPGELPLDGALVSAEIGAGRHTHVALALHHQLDRLVPGAFRLMANLVQPA